MCVCVCGTCGMCECEHVVCVVCEHVVCVCGTCGVCVCVSMWCVLM